METLTGFKWISRAPNLLFGFEEALGYLVDPEKVRDKDGISAAVDFLSLAADLHDRDLTIAAHLEAMAARFGAWASEQVSVRLGSTLHIQAIMDRLRMRPPTCIGAFTVAATDDLVDGGPLLPPSDTLRYTLADGARVVVRPSGTEPKLKAYIDVRADADDPATGLARAGALAAELASAVRDLLVTPAELGPPPAR